jgi:Carbamoyl-phosphate synthase L chain, ATP binding domain
MASKILIAQASDWTVSARLPPALKRAGAEVAVICPRDRALWKSGFIDRRFSVAPRTVRSILRRFSAPLRAVAPQVVTRMTSRLAPVADRLAHRPESSAAFTPNLISAIRKWRPDFVIPADERIRRLVHRLVSSSDPRRNSLEPELVAMLLKSVGDSRHFDVIERKTRLLDFARAAGLPVAPSSVVRDEHGATEFAKECGYPVVIKRDFTWGGLGVAVCQQPEDVAAAMNQVRGARLLLQSDPDAFSDSCGAPSTISAASWKDSFPAPTPTTRWSRWREGCSPELVRALSRRAVNSCQPRYAQSAGFRNSRGYQRPWSSFSATPDLRAATSESPVRTGGHTCSNSTRARCPPATWASILASSCARHWSMRSKALSRGM